MARRKTKAEPTEATVDETQWEDWRQLRDEIGKRLGGRDATGVSDPEVLGAARQASQVQRRKRA